MILQHILLYLSCTRLYIYIYIYPQALKECQERDLVPEMVFLLGRIGNNKQALTLIIERLNDVDQVCIYTYIVTSICVCVVLSY